MNALRDLACFASTLVALLIPGLAGAQALPKAASAWQAGGQPASRSALGLHLEATQAGLPCAATALVCDATDRTAHLRATATVGRYWGMELGYADSGRIATGEPRSQGMNLRLVGKAPLGQSLGVFGKLGTAYARPDTAVMGAGPEGFGLSYGAGLSFAFTPRLSATLEWDSNDFRFPGTAGEPVRSTSLGLRYRY
jgi:OOP family OmpA-OmpF porin